MAGNSWNDLGQDLNRIIDNAVHMGNYGRLNESINTVLRKAFNGIDPNGMQNGTSGWEFNLSKDKSDANSAAGSRPAGAAGQGAGSRATGGYAYNRPSNAPYQKSPNLYFAGGAKRKGTSIAIMVGGIVLAFITGMSFINLLIRLMISSIGNVSTSVTVGGIMAAVAAVLIVMGSRGLSLSKQFDQYVSVLDGKTYADIKTLAVYTNKQEAAVLKKVKKMLQKGWFTQGHLDHAETCLMVSHETFEQYINTVNNAKRQQEGQQRKAEEIKKEEAKRAGLTPEAKAVIDEGYKYIEQIRKSNDAIPGKEISSKIFKMELLVRRIFEQTEAHPENISDLRRLMDYYLPMTVKLLGAYEELDKQPVKGENITSSKAEIEATLDTLNIAFEKLLDSLFKDAAWDVSSDISVLQTMLAQEGLTKDDFKNNQ